MIRQPIGNTLTSKFTMQEKLCLLLLLLSPFSTFIAPFSSYYISMMDVIIPFMAIVATYFFGRNLLDLSKKKYVIPYFIVMMLVWCSPIYFHFERPSTSLLLELFFICTFTLLKFNARLWVYEKFLKILSIIFLLGIIEFFLSRIGVTHITAQLERTGVEHERTFYQGVFLILPEYWDYILFRFQSLAEEPGLIGTLSAFILITINAKKYKIQTIIFAISGILSMSLAFYLLMSIWIISKISFRNFKLLISIFICVTVVFVIFNDMLMHMIFERVLNGLRLGTIDNRSSDLVNSLYKDVISSVNLMFTGVGLRTFLSMGADASAGFKKVVVEYGLIPILIAIFATCKFFWQYNGKYKGALVTLIIFCISLYQRFDLNLITNTIVLFTALELRKVEYENNHMCT